MIPLSFWSNGMGLTKLSILGNRKIAYCGNSTTLIRKFESNARASGKQKNTFYAMTFGRKTGVFFNNWDDAKKVRTISQRWRNNWLRNVILAPNAGQLLNIALLRK